MTAAITTAAALGIFGWVIAPLLLIAFVGWLERRERIPMTDHERIPNDPTRSNQ